MIIVKKNLHEHDSMNSFQELFDCGAYDSSFVSLNAFQLHTYLVELDKCWQHNYYLTSNFCKWCLKI